MPRPRAPLAKAKAEGRDVINKGRFSGRNEPQGLGAIGDPPPWVTDTKGRKAATAWRELTKDLPWLNSSHRAHLSIACEIYGRVIAGQDVGVQALNLLRQSLGQMGGNPADATKVSHSDDDEEKDELLDD